MRDHSEGVRNGVFVGDPSLPTRVLFQPDHPRNYLRPAVPQQTDPVTTTRTIVVHGYAGGYNVIEAIVNPLSPVSDNVIPDTPVGTLRPDGGAPTSLSSNASDVLTAIPVSLAPVAIVGSMEVASNANRLERDSEPLGGIRTESGEQTAGGATQLLVTGGSGVGRIADLGRHTATSGSSPDVFGANHHVLRPAGGTADAPTLDYLCRTPFGLDGCSARR